MTDSQENALEVALRLAATEPASRPEFYKTLLEASVYVLGYSDGGADGSKTLAAGDKVSIENWQRSDGSPIIPFFSSLDALQRAITQEMRYMALPARTLLEMTKGAALVLNPKSDYGKEFYPEEIEALLTSGVNRVAEQRITQTPTQVLLGQPASYPTQMVQSLKTLLAKHDNVNAAYLALMHDPSHDEKAHLVVGIDVEGDFETVMREAGVVAADSARDGESVDLVRVKRGDGGLSDHLVRDVKPFYERGIAGKLRSFFGM